MDWKAHRKAKRATITATVIDGFRKEAVKAGLTLAQAIEKSIAQGWQGFDASWLGSAPRGSSGQRRNELAVPRVIPKDYYKDGNPDDPTDWGTGR